MGIELPSLITMARTRMENLADELFVGKRLTDQFGGDLESNCTTEDLQEKRIAFLCPSEVSYVASQWAVWRNGGIAVPLCHTHPESLWEYVLTDCKADVVIATTQYANTLQKLAEKHKMQFLPDW